MFSKIYLNSKNFIQNVEKIEEIAGHKICVMIKANAYGHGMKEVLSILNDKIDYFGVSNRSAACQEIYKEGCDCLRCLRRL